MKMSYSILQVSSGVSIKVSSLPKWMSGVWECGDHRFDDPDHTQYSPGASYPVLTPMQFYLAFTPLERIAIKTSTDAMVKEFWSTYQLAVQTDSPIHMEFPSNQQAIGYLARTVAAGGPGILAPERMPQVLQGLPQ